LRSVEIISSVALLGCSTAHASHVLRRSSTSCLVDSHHNGVEFSLELLLLGLIISGFSILVSLEPLEARCTLFFDGKLILSGELLLHFLVIELVLHLEAIVLKTVLLLNLGFDGIILILVLLSIGNHLVNFLL